MVALGSQKWLLWACISLLVTLPAGCTFPLVAAHSTGPDSSCLNEQPVMLAPISPVVDLAVDDQSIYLLTRANPGSVSKISRSDGEFQTLADLRAEPFGILVDEHSIYWVDGSWDSGPDFSLKKMEKRGGEVTELWNDQGSILQLTMDKDYLYWLDSETAGIWRLSKKDGMVERFASGLQDFSNLSVLNGTIYLGGSGGLRTLKSRISRQKC